MNTKELGTIFSMLDNEIMVLSNSSNLFKLGTKVYDEKGNLLGTIVEYFGNVKKPFYVVRVKENNKKEIKGKKVYIYVRGKNRS